MSICAHQTPRKSAYVNSRWIVRIGAEFFRPSLALLTFALFALVGGWIGAVFGFFAGWLVKAIARLLWFPALCVIGAWAILWTGY